MRRPSLRKALIWLAPGCLLGLSCPSGTGAFLAPIVQPVIGQVLSEVADALTDNLLESIQTP